MSEEQKPHAAPKAAASMATEPWEEGLREGGLAALAAPVLGEGLREASIYLGQPFFIVWPESVITALRFLREQGFEYLVDLTAVDYPDRTDRFEIIYILYSFIRNLRLRVKTQIADGQAASSITSLYPTANWLEREIFDLFGIPFEGHPDLRRILMPEDWRGHPLRKDYSIVQMDQQWVQTHLGIESGQ